jgi:hypothetical protein
VFSQQREGYEQIKEWGGAFALRTSTHTCTELYLYKATCRLFARLVHAYQTSACVNYLVSHCCAQAASQLMRHATCCTGSGYAPRLCHADASSTLWELRTAIPCLQQKLRHLQAAYGLVQHTNQPWPASNLCQRGNLCTQHICACPGPQKATHLSRCIYRKPLDMDLCSKPLDMDMYERTIDDAVS